MQTDRFPLLRHLLTLTVTTLLLGTTARAQDPAVTNTFANHHADLTAQINSRNVDQLQLAWSIPTQEKVSHTPLVDDGAVYFADWGGNVYKANAATGEIIWQQQALEQVKKQWPWYGFTGTGALGGGLLFEASTEGELVALDQQTGNVAWRTRIADDPQAGNIGKLTYYRGLVYVPLSSVEEPLTAKLKDFQPNFQGKVQAYDAETGEKVWETPLVTPPHNGVAAWSGFAIDRQTNMLYVTTGNNYTGEPTALSDALVALDAATGQIRWYRQVTEHDIWTMAEPKGPDYDFGAAPQLFEAEIDGVERQLVGAGQKSGIYHVWDRVTGEKVWTTTVGYGHVGGGIHAEASVGDGRLFIWGNNAYPYSNPKQNPMDIKAVDAASGAYLWVQTKAQPAVLTSAGFLANDVYFVGSLDGQVRAYRASDGQRLWTSPKHGAVASSIWVDEGLVLWGTGVPKRFGGDTGQNGVFAYTAQ